MNITYENNPLSKSSIQTLFKLTDKQNHQTETILQVVDIKQCKQNKESNNIMYTATLSDSQSKYNGFVIFCNKDQDPPSQTDIIKINLITPTFLESKKNRVFIIKKYDFVSKYDEIIGEPIIIKDEPVEKVEDIVMNNINEIRNQETPIKTKGKFCTPLKQLTTFSKSFTICIRVLKKTDIKTYNTQNKSNGAVFSFVIVDHEGTEMQITCFNKAVNKFYDLIKENKVYNVSGGYIKINDRKFTSVKSDYKIVIDENTEIEEVEDDGTIQQIKYDLTKISQVNVIPIYSVIDICGYVLESHEMCKKNTKNGELAMRKLIIADDSGYKMECTLWRVFAETIEPKVGQIIVLKNVKVGEFNGRNVSTYEDSVVIVDPDYLKESDDIKKFVENANGSLKTLSKEIKHDDTPKQSNVLFLKDVLELIDDTMNEDKYSHSKIKATVTQIIHNDKNYYGGCHDLNCKKKLQEDSHGYSCVNCNKTYVKPNYYYTLSVRVKDCSNEYWIDMMGNVAEKFMRMTAEEYKDILVSRNESRLKEITNDVEFKTYFFFVRPKLHFYNNVPKKKLYVSKLETVECVQDSVRLIKKLGNKN